MVYNKIMKKLILLLGLFFTLSSLASFADVIPYYSKNINYTGIGAFNPPNKMTIYAEPNENSNIVKIINWDETGLENKKDRENDIFVVFLPQKNIAYCSVDEETENWVKIYYSQKNGRSGWVKKTHKNRYVSWRGFYMSWGRKNGVYLFRDMPELNKKIMSAPNGESQKIADLIYPKFIKLALVRGNWMMVKVLDFGNETKVGWLQWRDLNGKFLAFPYLVN